MGARRCRQAGKKGVCMTSRYTCIGLTASLKSTREKEILHPGQLLGASIPMPLLHPRQYRLYQSRFGPGSLDPTLTALGLSMDPQGRWQNHHLGAESGAGSFLAPSH